MQAPGTANEQLVPISEQKKTRSHKGRPQGEWKSKLELYHSICFFRYIKKWSHRENALYHNCSEATVTRAIARFKPDDLLAPEAHLKEYALSTKYLIKEAHRSYEQLIKDGCVERRKRLVKTKPIINKEGKVTDINCEEVSEEIVSLESYKIEIELREQLRKLNDDLARANAIDTLLAKADTGEDTWDVLLARSAGNLPAPEEAQGGDE